MKKTLLIPLAALLAASCTAYSPSSGIIRGGTPNDIMTVEWSHSNHEKDEYSGGVEIDNTERRSVSYRDLRRSDVGKIYASLAQAREGQTVVIHSKPRKVKADPTLPDTVRMQNTDMEYVVYWTRRMVHRGYTVSISYDNDTAVYHCVAVRTQKKKKNNKN